MVATALLVNVSLFVTSCVKSSSLIDAVAVFFLISKMIFLFETSN